ncbi:MAG: recombinase family protein [Proteobacteria bacterium]|nr:recombinase family protein [Pseudomonadota bacterium]
MKSDKPTINCAIYTRKSTSQGLEQEFNSLDAQRESAEAYIASQKGNGWVCLPDQYNDGGFTGANMERPGLKMLLNDIETGKINCVVVYKVDRISRSLLDFSQLIQVFDRKNVSFVSITQNFDTNSSMGRLTLNILLSFSQFEREIISERTRDKISAARRKGKWTGGMPVLGYDVAEGGGRLIVNQDEALVVIKIFDLYLEHESLISTARELNSREWMGKSWTTKKGKFREGKRFDKGKVHKILTNPLYLGKLTNKDEIHDGEHEAIIDKGKWSDVQKILKRNSRNGENNGNNKYRALLKGLINCSSCKVAMLHTYTNGTGNKMYRYYVCSRAQKEGWNVCPTKSISAPTIEQFVVDRVCLIGRDSDLLDQTYLEANSQIETHLNALLKDQAIIKNNLKKHNNEMKQLVAKLSSDTGINSPVKSRMADLQDLIVSDENRLEAKVQEIDELKNARIDKKDLKSVFSIFDPVWSSLTIKEQARIIRLLIEQVSYDGEHGNISITFRPAGIKNLVREFSKN